MIGELAILVLVALTCGTLGHRLLARRGGLVVSMAVGLAGAFLGTIIARAAPVAQPFALRIDEIGFPLPWAIAGSFLLVALTAVLDRRLA